MTGPEFEKLIQSAGLNLISSYAPRFLVSLHVSLEYGVRVQTGCIEFESYRAFCGAETDEVVNAITEIKKRLLQSSQTQQGDVAKGGIVKVETKGVNAMPQAAINYPAH